MQVTINDRIKCFKLEAWSKYPAADKKPLNTQQQQYTK